jgi:hypothetical protein
MVEIPNGSSESVVGVVVVAVEGGVEMVCIGDGNPKVEEEVCSVSQASTKPSISNVVTKLRAPSVPDKSVTICCISVGVGAAMSRSIRSSVRVLAVSKPERVSWSMHSISISESGSDSDSVSRSDESVNAGVGGAGADAGAGAGAGGDARGRDLVILVVVVRPRTLSSLVHSSSAGGVVHERVTFIFGLKAQSS